MFSLKPPYMLTVLMSTDGTELVEAAPDDDIWVIGLRASDPRAQSKKTWIGLNLLGKHT